MNKPPNRTSDIFSFLNKGKFLSQNAVNEEEKVLYSIVEENFDDLYEYFLHIDLFLTEGDGYYYFSRDESRQSLENKLQRFLKLIDVLDFFKTFDPLFTSGYRFTVAMIAERCRVDSNLQMKLNGIETTSSTEKIARKIQEIVDDLVKSSQCVLENEIDGTYKILSSFRYLEKIISGIEIAGEKNEITE